EPIWLRKKELEQALFISDPDQDFPTFWTTLPKKDPVLTAWTAGSLCDHLIHLSPEELLDRALASAAHVLDEDEVALREQLQAWHYHDWINDPFSRGAYSYVMPGGL